MPHDGLHEDEDDLDYLLDEDDDDWDESAMLPEILAKHPEFSHLVRLRGFTLDTLREVDAWLPSSCKAAFRRIGWSSGCSTSVGVLFVDITDALMFKLRWC